MEQKSGFLDIFSEDYILEYIIGNFYFTNYFDYFSYDFDIIINFRYNTCNLNLIDFILEGFFKDMSDFIVFDALDLRNNYF